MLTQDRRPRFYVNQLFTILGLKNQELTAKFVEIFNLLTYNKIVNLSLFIYFIVFVLSLMLTITEQILFTIKKWQ